MLFKTPLHAVPMLPMTVPKLPDVPSFTATTPRIVQPRIFAAVAIAYVLIHVAIELTAPVFAAQRIPITMNASVTLVP
jgi:hypothetical protein